MNKSDRLAQSFKTYKNMIVSSQSVSDYNRQYKYCEQQKYRKCFDTPEIIDRTEICFVQVQMTCNANYCLLLFSKLIQLDVSIHFIF